MKKLMFLIALTASVWSSFSYSVTTRVSGFQVVSGAGSGYTFSHSELYVSCTRNDDACIRTQIAETLNANHNGLYLTLTACTTVSTISVSPYTCTDNARLIYSVGAQGDIPPSNTCKMSEGNYLVEFHSSVQPYCVEIGNTGGTSQQPLLCLTKDAIEAPTGSGNFTHFVSQISCSTVNGPDGGQNPPDPDPEPPCTENCEPTDPETPPTGGNDGSDIPSTGGGSNTSSTTATGTTTDSQGNVTDIEMTLEQDLTPVTERLNEVNQRLQAENENSSTIIDKLNDLITGNTTNGQKLDGIKDAINNSGGGTDTSGIESRLDQIIDAIGTEQEGESAAAGTDLPDVEQALNDGFDAIQDAINSDPNNNLTDGLSDIGSKLNSFDSIPRIFEFASESCSPIDFGGRSLNLCPYAAASSNILSWVLTIFVMIFIVTSVISDIKRVRFT